MATKKKAFDFEQAMIDLEATVKQLEVGQLSLEDSIKVFEQGVKLTRECQQALSEAEQKVELLMQQGKDWVAQPFDSTDSPK